MDFDFNLILVPATLIFVAIWLLDKFVLKQRQTRGKGNENFIITWAYDFWPVLTVVLILRSFLYEPFNIPSDSMVPTLETGDFILVNKFDYGVKLPIVNTKIIDTGHPERGDVAVFRYPPQPTISYIKRIIGLPGDHIVYDHGQLIINGQKVEKVPVEFSREKDRMDTPNSMYHKETIGEHTFTMRELENVNVARQAPFINYVDNGKYSTENGLYWEIKVPEGYYFAMGDNRDQSADSRFWGFVPEENLTGRAFYIWMHKEPGFKMPSFNRNGMID
ncbi:signal peptidase I [Acinetobacter sp. 10FS3-1]|mgnify:FL=1|uniref:signal peptidase I n=1 Tax=Acinetobacter sp. 10FS3-1 TaxID=2563897 RepID=UPI00157C5742|nr:signal peptidase I [Acinetobacter sp. 10FS3-1]MDM1780636.1 signal peptidase I [Acinetobacter indicus]QKQ69500.1 signal peptidase I [Acinetobacter sp. 10FS3-1]